jgi:hypothetical protein
MSQKPTSSLHPNAFEAQFQPHGDGFLYRKARKGDPIPVTRAERDGFIAAYERRQKFLIGGLVAALLGWSLFITTHKIASYWEYVVMAILMAAAVVQNSRAWNAPARALKGRMPQKG